MFHLEFVFTAKPKWRLLRNGPESSAHMSKHSTLRLGWSTPVAKLLIVEATKNAHRYITCGNMAVITPIRHVQEKRMKYLCLFNLSNTSPAVKPPVSKNFLDHLLWPDWSKNMKEEVLKVSRSRNKNCWVKTSPKNEGTNLFFYPEDSEISTWN